MNTTITRSNVARYEKQLRATPHRYALIFTDFVLLNLAFFIASAIEYGTLNYTSVIENGLFVLLFVNLSWGWLCMYFSAYSWYERIRMEQQLTKMGKIILLLLAATSVFYYNILMVDTSGPFLLIAHSLMFIMIFAGRIVHRVRGANPFHEFKYAIVGGKENNLRHLQKAYEYAFPGSAHLVGRFGNQKLANLPNLGSYDDIRSYLLSGPDIDKLVFFYSDLTQEEQSEIMRLCETLFIDVEVAPREVTIFPRGYKTQQLGHLSILTLQEEPLFRLRNKIVKRFFDAVFSTLVLMFIFPIMFPIVAFLIYREDPGPIFFRQERSGYRNNIFRMWKFRTMKVNKDSDSKQATRDDDRILKIGAFLRRTSLDEFPQFINVWLGDMSVVGPRPHMLKHTQEYSRIIDNFMIRHKIKPGVTGWAQVNGFRGPTDKVWKMKKRVEYDVTYLENWSLLLDIRCVIQTIINAAVGEENAL